MELRHFRYFVAVADSGSFVRAAEQLHISQPPLSMQIKDLESDLEVKLFERSSKGVTLTPAGHALYAEARAVLARVEHARITARRADRGELGSLSVGFVSTADYHVLPGALKHFRERYPTVEIQLHELTTDAQLKELAAERIDVGIALGPIREAGVGFTPLLREKLVLALPIDHRVAKKGSAVALRTLHKEAFVMAPRHLAPGLHDITASMFHAAGFVPQIGQYARQMQTIISLVAGGFGLAVVPESLRHLQRTGVRYVALTGKCPFLETGLVHRLNTVNPAVARFKESVAAAASLLGALGSPANGPTAPRRRTRRPARRAP